MWSSCQCRWHHWHVSEGKLEYSHASNKHASGIRVPSGKGWLYRSWMPYFELFEVRYIGPKKKIPLPLPLVCAMVFWGLHVEPSAYRVWLAAPLDTTRNYYPPCLAYGFSQKGAQPEVIRPSLQPTPRSPVCWGLERVDYLQILICSLKVPPA